MQLRKRIEHLLWKHNGFLGNCVTAIIFLAFLACFFMASTFGFWLQMKVAAFVFG